MQLDDTHPGRRMVYRAVAVFTVLASVLCAMLAIWCTVHSIWAANLAAQAPHSFCGNCQREINAQLAARIGASPEQAIPIGILCAGGSLTLGIQSIRFANQSRPEASRERHG